MYVHKKIHVAILAILAVTPAFAENKMEELELGEVEVVSTTPLSTLGLPVSQVPANVQVVKGQAIQDQQSLGIADFISSKFIWCKY